MWASRYLTSAVLVASALQISLQAQESGSSPKLGAIHLEWPSTVEYQMHEHHQDRPAADRDYILVMANDSLSRELAMYKFADGHISSHVFDPVAAQQIWWGTELARAEIVKYPTPVAERSSCWRSLGSEKSPKTGKPQRYEFKTDCAPAGPPPGLGQSVDCRDVHYAERLAKALSPVRSGFPKCEASPGGTAEDLGTNAIQGISVQGCRTLTPFLRHGDVLSETWSDEYGLTLRETKEYANGDKFVRELISLSRDEPNESIFQPVGYEGVTLEMDEVPCEPVPPPVYSLPALEGRK